MAEIKIGKNESLESALRRFNVNVSVLALAEARKREHYEKPSVRRKKSEAARKREERTKNKKVQPRGWTLYIQKGKLDCSFASVFPPVSVQLL